MKHHNYNYTHNIHWQNSQNFISLLGQKEQEIKSHEKSYQTLSGTQKTEFINLIKSTALDPLKHELKNNYFESDMIINFKASIERLESVIDSWATGVIQQPKQPNPNYLKLDQYTSQQLSAKEFVELHNKLTDLIEQFHVVFVQLPNENKLEYVDQIKLKVIKPLEQQLRTGIYSPNARHEYEQAIKKMSDTINSWMLPSVIIEQNLVQEEIIHQPELNNEEAIMLEELKKQLEQFKLQMEQRNNTIEQLQTENHDLTDRLAVSEENNGILKGQVGNLTEEKLDLVNKLATSEENNGILQNKNHDLTDKLIVSEENNGILKNEIHTLTDKLITSEMKNVDLQNKLNVSEAKLVPLQKRVEELKDYKKSLENDKIELREDKKMLTEYNKNLQEEKKLFLKEKDLLLVDKKHFQDLNLEQALKITELIQPRCDFPEHGWEKIDVPISGKDSNIIQNDSD